MAWRKQIWLHLEKKKHVIWDWNGTLLNDVEHAVASVNSLLEKHELPLVDRERYREIFDFPVEHYYRRLGFDFQRESFVELSHRFVDFYMANFHGCALVDGAKEILDGVKAAGKTQSVLSAADQVSLEHMLKHYGIYPYFENVYGIGDKFASSKVHRGHELMARAAVAAEETLLIGDTLHDLEVGKALGIDVLLVSHGHQSRERLHQQHKLVL